MKWYSNSNNRRKNDVKTKNREEAKMEKEEDVDYFLFLASHAPSFATSPGMTSME